MRSVNPEGGEDGGNRSPHFLDIRDIIHTKLRLFAGTTALLFGMDFHSGMVITIPNRINILRNCKFIYIWER